MVHNVDETVLDEETAFLRTEIYARHGAPDVLGLIAFTRISSRV
ncbi:hypothetical protein [Bradyrhizobium canariense]|nr:hypothetical protein [Bradyrhizobium canariense]